MAITLDTISRTPILKTTAAKLSKAQNFINMQNAKNGDWIDSDEFIIGSGTKACIERFRTSNGGLCIFTKKGNLTKEGKKLLSEAMEKGELPKDATTWTLLDQRALTHLDIMS